MISEDQKMTPKTRSTVELYVSHFVFVTRVKNSHE